MNEKEYKWVTNMPDNLNLLSKGRFEEYMIAHPDQVQYLKWYQECKFGDPQATERYSMQDLASMGMVGAYRQ